MTAFTLHVFTQATAKQTGKKKKAKIAHLRCGSWRWSAQAFQSNGKVGPQDSFLDELRFLPALRLVESEQYKRGVLLEKAVGAPVGESSPRKLSLWSWTDPFPAWLCLFTFWSSETR